jgi:hypothetical protein
VGGLARADFYRVGVRCLLPRRSNHVRHILRTDTASQPAVSNQMETLSRLGQPVDTTTVT